MKSITNRYQITLVVVISLLSFITSPARNLPADYKSQSSARISNHANQASKPTVFHTAHGRGNIRLAVANNGTFGTFGETIPDPFSGEPLPSCEYPRGSQIVFLWVAAFWIGAIIDQDTLVSCGSEDFYNSREFWPEVPELGGEFTYSSIDASSQFYDPNKHAFSEEDIYVEYYDTITDPGFSGTDPFENRGHKPINLKISQRTMAWSYEYADDFILFDYNIENIGRKRLKRVYIGIWVDGDTWHVSRNGPEGWDDDMTGFYETHPAPEGGNCVDQINIAYHADNDGDPEAGQWNEKSAKGVVGTRVVRTPSDSLEMAFNWWIINYSDASKDFGPRQTGTTQRPFRSFGDRLGTPTGDANKYHVLSSSEFDYDLMETAVSHVLQGWLPPPPDADAFSRGFDCRYLLSFGPFDIEPGQSLPVTFAWVGGENFHQNPTDYEKLFDPSNPEKYINSLNFSNLSLNARWASWVYDNPGVDTDGDGYYGKYRFCTDSSGIIDSSLLDTNWYEGDGVPDFRGAGPPPAPKLKVIPSIGKLTLRWNGFYSENTRDVFTGRKDFEGYRVYTALDERPSSFSVQTSYDLENYSRLTWDNSPGNVNGWTRDEVPFSLENLRQIYNDPNFDPNRYTRNNPLVFGGQFFYFEMQDYNRSSLLDPAGIRKVYPEATNPGTDSTTWLPDEITREHVEALPKYYEYEYVVKDILPTIPYLVSVTAFDHGSPNAGLSALETKPENNFIKEYPQNSADSAEINNLDIYIYPNPYRIDANYAERGFENRLRDKPTDRARLINFANLPKVCKISIFSIDGDMIRELDHNYPDGGPGSMHDSWDMITRNSQTVVSGIYYWVVESSERTQIGKLVVIK